MEALRRIAASLFGVLMSLEPAMAAVSGFVILGQQLSARAVLGIALVVAASVGASLHSRRTPTDICRPPSGRRVGQVGVPKWGQLDDQQ